MVQPSWLARGTGALLGLLLSWGSLSADNRVASVPLNSGLTPVDVTYGTAGTLPLLAVNATRPVTVGGIRYDQGTSFYLVKENGQLVPFVVSTDQSSLANSAWSPAFLPLENRLYFLSNSTARSKADYHFLCRIDQPTASRRYLTTESPPVVTGHMVPGGQGLSLHKTASGNGLAGVLYAGGAHSFVTIADNGASVAEAFRRDNADDAVYDDTNGVWYFLGGRALFASRGAPEDELVATEPGPVSLGGLSVAGHQLGYLVSDRTSGTPLSAVLIDLVSGTKETVGSSGSVTFLKLETVGGGQTVLTYGLREASATTVYQRNLRD